MTRVFHPSAARRSPDFGLKAGGRAAIVPRPDGMAPAGHTVRRTIMKLRSLVLLSCMVIVPLVAMFSHLIPADCRMAVRRHFAAATRIAFESATPAVAATPAPPPSPPAPVAPPEPAVAQLADRTRQVRDQQARDQQTIEKQLKSLGAVSFECRPQAGPEGLYSSTCRVPVDATGQLQRVFQASGHDPGSASVALLDQVMAWRQRVATRTATEAAGGADGPATLPTDRFR